LKDLALRTKNSYVVMGL